MFFIMSRDSLVDIAMSYGLDSPGFDSWLGQEIFLCSTVARTAMRLTQSPIQWVPGALSPGVKHLGCEADHSPPSNAELKNAGAIPPLPYMSS
jgi:hypothetical protein